MGGGRSGTRERKVWAGLGSCLSLYRETKQNTLSCSPRHARLVPRSSPPPVCVHDTDARPPPPGGRGRGKTAEERCCFVLLHAFTPPMVLATLLKWALLVALAYTAIKR